MVMFYGENDAEPIGWNEVAYVQTNPDGNLPKFGCLIAIHCSIKCQFWAEVLWNILQPLPKWHDSLSWIVVHNSAQVHKVHFETLILLLLEGI